MDFYFGRGFCAVGQSNGGDRCDGKSYVVAFARSFLLVGLFAASCFISLSVGTIVALVPVAAGLADKTGIALPYMTAIVVGGAFSEIICLLSPIRR